ncbi:MAG: catalytic domain of component of various dehydrogenase complexe [Spartobacteria bacterium]|nr:catalytic domain of component of various dehydrogenase complexe [Spartobacteria bacterium]
MALPIVMPSFGMYTAEGVLVSWLCPSGASVREGDPILEIETDKATQEVVAPGNGFLHHVVKVGARLHEQMLIGYVLAEGEKPPVAAEEPALLATHPNSVSNPSSSEFIKATPIARRLAREQGIALATIAATGPGGRIVEADVLAAKNRRSSGSSSSYPVIATNLRIRERVPFAGMRRMIADRLKHSQNSAVSVTLTREIQAKKLSDTRIKWKEAGDLISIDALFVKILALALRSRPELNVVVSGDELLLLDEVNVGFAVATSEGLSVPVIREADRLPLPEISRRVRDLADSARSARLKMSEIEGGTSTISNLGAFGVDGFTPTLNPPQSTILGIGRILPRPVAQDGNIQVLPTVWLSLTFDHRVADGVAAAQLLDSIAEQLNDEQALNGLMKPNAS